MKLLKIFTLLIFPLLFIRCDKDKTDDGQGGGTSTANSFSCYVNGVYWQAEADFTWGGATAVSGELNIELSKFKLVGTKKIMKKNTLKPLLFLLI